MRWLIVFLLLVTQAAAQTAIRPDQICPGGVCATPDITWQQVGPGYQIGSTIPWRTDSSSTPSFTCSVPATSDNAKTIELTFNGPISATLPAATGCFGDGAGFTIQTKTGTLTLTPTSGSPINGQTTPITVGPYQLVGLASKGGIWYANLSVPQPTTQTGTNVLADNMTWGAGGSAPPTCSATTGAAGNFLTRVAAVPATLDTTHTNAYVTLICGLVTDGVAALGDALYIYATNTATGTNTTVANLNLLSANFNGTLSTTPPTFTANAGFQGANASSTLYINTGFNPVTATSPHYTQNSASLMAWSLTDIQATGAGGSVLGSSNAAFTQVAEIALRDPSGLFLTYVNFDATASSGPSMVVTQANGGWLANRSGSAALQGYLNGSSYAVSPSNAASVVLPSLNFFVLAANINGSPGGSGSANQIAAAWIGGSLTATQVSSLTTTPVTSANAATATGLIPRVCTFLFAVHGSC